jgi:hypothetical protein
MVLRATLEYVLKHWPILGIELVGTHSLEVILVPLTAINPGRACPLNRILCLR